MSTASFRLVTRSDFDGLVCAILLQEAGIINDDIVFVHPKDVQDGVTPVCGRDILTNLPYRPEAHLVFDHHASELVRNTGERPANYIIDPEAPSAARVVYNHYGGIKTFPHVSESLMEAVDKADSANYTLEEVLNPEGWFLLNTIMDARTGLGRFRNFRISNYDLMMRLISFCRIHKDVNDVLALDDVRERTSLFFSQQEEARAQLLRCTTVHDRLAVVDLRNEDPIWSASRFLLYALFPDCNISIHVMRGKANQNTVFAVGKSILNRTSQAHIGNAMLQYGGGGHRAAGTCQIPNEDAEVVLTSLINAFSLT